MGSKQELSLVLVVACFFCVPAYGQQPRLELIEVGGPVATPAIRVPAGEPVGNCDPANTPPTSMDVPAWVDAPAGMEGNIARAADAVTFGSPAATCNSQVDNINDGLYGACSAWHSGYSGADSGPLEIMDPIQGSIQGPISSKYVGIYWTGGGRDIYEIALGRDNVNPDRRFDAACGSWGRGKMEPCREDCFPFKIYYRTVAFAVPGGGEEKCPYPDPCNPGVDPNCQDADWINDGNWIELGDAGGHIATSTVGLRHRYRLVDDQGNDDPLQNVQAIRIVNWPILGGVSIDEVEIGDAPNALGDPPTTDLLLRETGGPFTTPAAADDVPIWDDEENLARRDVGDDAVPFGSSSAGVANLNDGLYGNAWVGSPVVATSSNNLPADCNQDGAIDLSDVICILGHLFQGTPATLPCGSAAANLTLMDCNDDGSIDLSDAIYKLAWLFQGGPQPERGVACLDIPGCPENPACSGAGAGAGMGETFAGIYFNDDPVFVREIAFGRDNTGVETDRAVGAHTIQFTLDAFDPTNAAAAASVTWTDVHPRRRFATAHLGSNPGLRRRYVINDPGVRYTPNDTPPVQMRAIRILTADGNAIDEIEVSGGDTDLSLAGQDYGIRLRFNRDNKLTVLAEDLSELGGPNPRDTVTFPNGERDVPTWEDGNLARAKMGLAPERNPCANVGGDPGAGCDPVTAPCTTPICATPPRAYGPDSSAFPGTPTDAVAFGTLPFNHGQIFSTIPRINDGIYGVLSSSIEGGPEPATGQWYVGIYWTGGQKTFNRFALGLDNDLVPGGTDGARHRRKFVLQYTQDDFDFPHERWRRPDKAVAGAIWVTIGIMDGHQEGGQGPRHVYDFPAVTARAVRVLTRNNDIRGLQPGDFTAIDEVEVYNQP